MYAFATLASKIGDAVVDFDHGFGSNKYHPDGEPAIELQYWRKHPNLHGWMHHLYINKGGQSQSFNGDAVRLTLEDIDRLEKDVQAKALPMTSGFFFGASVDEDSYDDLNFIDKARNALKLGLAVYYTSSW